MKVIIGNEKTTALIRQSAETGFYIVCTTSQECSRVFWVAKKMGLDIHFPISFYEFVHKQYHSAGIKGFLIDNADMLLQQMSRLPIAAISIGENDAFRPDPPLDH